MHIIRRVTALELIREEEELNYDKEKHREMLLEAAETVRGYFGFDRTIYDAKATNKKNRKWWDGLKQEQMIDIQTEKV
ncbi:MAG: hypothetical protein WCF23_09205 [Candidatus Nitrosopolaris sp.]